MLEDLFRANQSTPNTYSIYRHIYLVTVTITACPKPIRVITCGLTEMVLSARPGLIFEKTDFSAQWTVQGPKEQGDSDSCVCE